MSQLDLSSNSTFSMADWLWLIGIVLAAAVLRLLFFNGFFGSDDLVYLARSNEIANGIWTSANYNGSLRYGYNIPAALPIYLFGLNIFTANAWTLFCSLAEIAIVYFFAARFINRQTAILAALLLATVPLHMALGTRIHADSAMAFFLTLSFVLFYSAESSNNKLAYFAAGLAMGMIFWVKELGVITLLVFATYPLLVRRWNPAWGMVIAGGLVMLAGHLILMQIIAGDPLHLFKTVTGQVEQSFIHGGAGEDSPGYYFWYLFADIKHTWLAPFLAAAAILLIIAKLKQTSPAIRYIAWWLLGLLAVLSFLPVSLSPLRFAMKQSNYLSLFLAPITLLGAYFVQKMRRSWAAIVLSVTLVGGILLGALEQLAYQSFTANSRAAVSFLKSHPDEWMVGSVNNANWGRINALLDNDPILAKRFGYYLPDGRMSLSEIKTQQGYAIFDQQTMSWGSTSAELPSVPTCWKQVGTTNPQLFGMGPRLVDYLHQASQYLPQFLQHRLAAKLESLRSPEPASIYRVDAANLDCRLSH